MLSSLLFILEMSSDFEDYDKPPAPPVRLTSTKYSLLKLLLMIISILAAF